MAQSYPYPIIQRQFIEETREAVDTDDNFFHSHDWRNVTPKGGKYCSLTKAVFADSFYVRPMAIWVPHKLLPNFVPSCPHCKSNQGVNVLRARWLNSPKVLYGLKGHRFLDSMLYPCQICKHSFAGYNPDSLKLDSAHFTGFFNFHMSGRFAVDEELYSYICSCYSTPTKEINRILQSMAVDTYLNDYNLYLHAVRSNKIKLRRKKKTLKAALEGIPVEEQLSEKERLVRLLRGQLRTCRLNLLLANGRAKQNICFRQLRKIKLGRNSNESLLPGVGAKKLEQLIKAGIHSGHELVEYFGVPEAWSGHRDHKRVFKGWQKKVAELFETRRADVREREKEVKELESQLAQAESEVAEESARLPTVPQEPEPEPEKPGLFSKMTDKDGYDCRVLSKQRIDQLLMTDYQHRKPTQQAKMMGLGAEVLKLDFEYKIVAKVHVYTGVGKCFKPYKCLVTCQNEDNQTVYYKVCQGSESIDEIIDGLKAFRARNPRTVKVIYVDNCCTTRAKLQSVFPDCLVKLDPFHWFKRWEPVLYDNNSEEAAIFRGMMRRAVFMADIVEYNRAREVVKQRLVKRGKLLPTERPTHRQIMSEARTTIPEKEVLESNVMAVLRYCYQNDVMVALKKASQDTGDTTALPNPFFKPMDRFVKDKQRVRDVIRNQLSHIKCNCLSDPPNVVLHKKNPKTGKIYCCRGTNSCETDNLHLDRITGHHIGVARADRLLATYFELSNDRKMACRNGQWEDALLFTYRTEKLAMTNCLAESAGQQLPFDQVCHPATPREMKQADIGFDRYINTPDEGNEATNVEDENENSDDNEEEEDTNEDEDENTEETTEESQRTEEVEKRVQDLLPEIFKRESTMDAFRRLTKDQPWIPFTHTAESELDVAEAALFASWKSRYYRNRPPRNNLSYYSFMSAWNLEVQQRYKKRMVDGDERTVLINRKSVEQLQQYHDTIEAQLNSSVRAQSDSREDQRTNLQAMNTIIRNNRNTITPLPEVENAVPITYEQTGPMPIGNPTVLNPEVTAGAFEERPNPQRNPVPFVVRPPRTAAEPLTTEENPLANWNRRLWCIKCGYRRLSHPPAERFGNKCLKDCCGKCYQRLEFHPNGKMGVFCPFQPHPTESQHRLWFVGRRTQG